MNSEEFNLGELYTRFWEIDFLRGVAIILMIISNFATDLDYFNVYNFHAHGFWWWFARAVASIFLLLVGISLTLSYSRARILKKQGEEKNLTKKYIKRGLRIFGWGLLITVVTWIFMAYLLKRGGFVIFGVLHLIGASIILTYPLLNYRYLNFLLGTTIIMTGIYLKNFTLSFPWLLWLGFKPQEFYSVDYFPLFPWLGVVIIGIFLGNTLYKDYRRKFEILNLSSSQPVEFLCLLGRNSLFIYFIHQPILLVFLFLVYIL